MTDVQLTINVKNASTKSKLSLVFDKLLQLISNSLMTSNYIIYSSLYYRIDVQLYRFKRF